MKNLYTILFALIALLFSSCSSDNSLEPTPPTSDVYLHKMIETNDSYQTPHFFEYDENYNLIKYQIDEPAYYYFNYQYENNLIIREDEGGQPTYGYCDYVYNSSVLKKITYTHGYEDQKIDEFEFNADHTFYTRTYTDNCFSCDPDISTVIEYSNYATYNSDAYLTKLETIDETYGGDSQIINFEYTNRNLTKIIDSDNNVWELSYDSNPSFKTFKNNLVGTRFYFGVGNNYYLDYDFVSQKLRNIPFFYNYQEQNNVTQVKKNGILFAEITYEYNELDYPNKATFNNDPINYSFEYLQQ